MSFEALDDSCIQRLYKQSHIGLKVQEANIFRLILDIMAREIVKCETDMPVLVAHFDIKILDIPEGKLSVKDCSSM